MLAAETMGIDQLGVHHRRQSDPSVVNKDFATRHARAEVVSHGAKHHQRAPGHVLRAMLPHAFDPRRGTTIAPREPLAGSSSAEQFAAGRAVENGVAEQVWFARIVGRRPYDDPPTAHPLS